MTRTYEALIKKVEAQRKKVYEELKAQDTQQYYREKVNELTNLRGIKKKTIAEKIGINRNSMYQWLRGDFSLKEERLDNLKALINLFE